MSTTPRTTSTVVPLDQTETKEMVWSGLEPLVEPPTEPPLDEAQVGQDLAVEDSRF